MYYVVRSLRLTNYLVRMGFDIEKVDDSKDDSKFKVFLFRDCKQLREIIKNFK